MVVDSQKLETVTVTSIPPNLEVSPVPGKTATGQDQPDETPSPDSPPLTPIPGTTGQLCPVYKDKSQFPRDGTFSGSLVLREVVNRPYLFLDMQTGNQHLVPEGDNHSVGGEAISPDHRWLAFSQATFRNSVNDFSGTPWVLVSEEIVVVSADGKVASSVAKQERWRSFEGAWANSSAYLVNRSSPFLVRFNPFTGLWDEFSFDAPNRYFDDYDDVKVKANQVHEQFVYLKKDLASFIVWDWRNQVSLVEIPFATNYWHMRGHFGLSPKWSPDGEHFVIVGSQEGDPGTDYPTGQVYIVSQMGQVTRLTNFPEEAENTYELGQYSWSPDGQKIAIWVNFDPKEDTLNELVVIDVPTGEAVRYCILNDVEITDPVDKRVLYGEDTRLPPIWSPDSSSIMVQSARGIWETRLTLINLDQGVAWELDYNARPVGWMTAAGE